MKELVPSVMKLLIKKAISIHFSGCGKQKIRNFSTTKIAAAVFGKYFINENISLLVKIFSKIYKN